MTDTMPGTAARPVTVDGRRRLALPSPLADAAGITPGRAVVLAGDRPGEVRVVTPAAALARLRADIAAALPDVDRPLSTAVAAEPGRAPAWAPTGTSVLPEEGQLVTDAAPLAALLDGDPDADAVADLLPRLVVTESAVAVLFGAALRAGLTVAGTPGRLDGYQPIMDTLEALGLTVADHRHEWTAVHILDYAMQRAGVAGVGERSALVLATHLGVPALLGRPAGELPGEVTATVVDYRDLTVVAEPTN
ncbi:hypothetical protein [Polymorphospora sp. NPDC050346]|uniref:hypothetical protein n=1 Tax=Polymorphospora sp. NPDC050346 TaxID=3155780 RepID=UPI0033D77DF3